MVSSFCSMALVAGWIFAREIIRRTKVFYPVYLKKYWKKLDKHLWRDPFCESGTITHHSLLRYLDILLEILGWCWLKYEKIKKLRRVWRNSCFKLKQMNYINCCNKEHMRFDWGLGVVAKTNDEIDVSTSIAQANRSLLFVCFLCCAKKRIVVECIEIQLAAWKIVTMTQSGRK